MSWNEKQKPQRLRRYAAMLIMLLTLGVGQMWGEGQCDYYWKGKVYFRAPNSWDLSTYKYTRLGVARTTDTNTNTYQDFFGQMTQISNTRLFYLSVNADHSSWKQCEYIFFTANNNKTYNSGTFNVNNSHYYTVPKDYGCNNSSNYYLFNPTSDVDGPSVNADYNGTRNNLFKKTYTIQVKVKKAGSDSYSTPSSTTEMPATSISVTAYYLNGDNTSTSNTVSLSGTTYSNTFYGCPGGKITLSQTAKDGYTFDGFYVSNSSVTSPYYPTSGSAITIEARYTEDSYSLTFSHDGNGSIAVAGSTIASGSTAVVGYHNTKTLVATPNTGYRFTGWTVTGTNNDKVTIADKTSTGTSTTIKATGAGATVTAGFTKKTYAITLDKGDGDAGGEATIQRGDGALTISSHASKDDWNLVGYWTSEGDQLTDDEGNLIADVGDYTDGDGNWIYDDDATLTAHWSQTYSLTVNAGSNISSVTGSNADVTLNSKYAISATPLSGYSFSGWTASPVANGEFDDASSASTNVTVKNGNVIVTGAATENLTTVTVNVSPAGAGTLTLDAAAFTPGNTTTAGVTTGHTIVATPASGKVFHNWTKSGNTAGSASTTTYNLKGSGSAGTGTLTANFGVASGWYMYGNDPWGNTWDKSKATAQLTYPYRGMSGVYYIPTTIAASKYFRITDKSSELSFNSGTSSDFAFTKGTIYSLVSNTAKAIYSTTNLGDVWVVVNTNGTTKKAWVQSAQTFYNVNVTNEGSGSKGTYKVTLNSTSAFTKGSNVFETTQFANGETFTVTVTGVTGYIPSIKIGSNDPVTWWKEQTTYTADGTMSTSDVTVTITYTPTRAVTFATTTGCASLTATGPSSTAVTTGTKVKDGTVIRFAQTASTGYTFSKWYSNNTGTSGTEYSTSSSAYDLTISSTSYTIYPLYTENSYSTTVAVSPAGKGSISSPTPVDGKINVSHHTGTSVTASPADHYAFVNWAVSSGGLTMASSNTTNPNIFNATSTGGTITANFALQWALKGGDSSQGSPDALGDWGTYNGMTYTGTANTYRVSITLAARTTYDFKIVNRRNGYMYGKNSGNSFTRGGTTSASGCSTGAGSTYNLHVTTDAAGSYTFTYNTSTNTITVGFPTAYTITFDKGTGGSTITATASASGTLSSGNYVASGEDVTFTQTANTGYTFAGWYDAASGGSAVSGMGVSDPVLENVTANKTVYSRYTAHTYQVRFYKNDVGASGTMSNQSFTYDEASKALTSNAFYKDGYSFDYWTTASDGTGTQYTDGQSVQNLSSTNNDVVDLYAHWTEVTITDLTFEPASAAGSTTVTVTPVLSGTPTGTSSICWGLYYDAACTREVPGIEFSASPSAGAASVTFTSPASSGSYYVKATYRTGSACNAGTVLGEPRIEQYVVASKHDLTVKYMCGSTEITSRRIVEIPAASYTLVAPADVFGYTFSSWSAGDGVAITDPTDAEKEEAGLDGVANVKKVTANYDGILTANYTRDNIIYLKNTLNWDTAFVNLYPNAWFGSDANGAGAGNHDLADAKKNKGMKRVPGHSDIWYYNYGNTATTEYVSFTDRSQNNYYHFSGSTSNRVKVIYPTRPDATQAEAPSYGFNSGTPMFVPVAGQTGQKWNGSTGSETAEYFNKGYWRKYEPATGKTGYTLEIYNKTPDSSRDTVYTIPMVESTSDGDIFEATVILEANKTGDSKYGVKFRRDNGMRYTKTSGSFAKNGDYSVFTKSPDNYAAYGMETTVAGEYTFRIACANDGTLKMAVKYPASAGDYRLVYTDDVHSLAHPSEIVRKEANGSDIVSFFVREDQSPSIQMQSCSLDGSGNVSWSNYGVAINPASTYSSVITKDGVYNFHLAMDEDGALTISKVEPYTGEFYIRTDAVGGTKWADFRNEAHRMKYSDYAAANKGFTHYYVQWVTQNSNVKFTVANDYSPCISDTLIADVGTIVATIDGTGKMTSANANIRYMYNVTDNSIKRAYIAGAQDNGSYFLVLQGENGYITDPSSNRLMSANGNNYNVDNDATQLADNNEWLYKISVKATPGGKVKLYAKYNNVSQYFIGKAPLNDWSTADASEVLMSGTGGAQNISVVYDFKTDRMIAAWEPSDEINTAMTLNADILIVREHQEAASNITFSSTDKSLTTAKTVYGVMRFYRNTLDNRDGDGNILPVADQLPQRERYHYYISFPFDVNVSDIFGFGSYGVHWVLQYYDGKERAKNGLWADPGMTYWKYVPPTGKLNANEGYLLALSPSKMAYTNTADGQVWAKGKTVVELYFPDATMGATIADGDVTIPAPGSDYQCTIWRGKETGEHEGDRNYDRRIADSYWRCIGVPSFKNFDDELEDSSDAFAWVDPAAYETGDIHFLYEVQWADYSLRAVSGDNYDFKAMHAYMVQNSTAIVWNNVNAISHVSSIVARHRNADEIDNVEFRLELQQNNELVDQTFVRLSDDDMVTTGFEFNHDMSKELYSTKANIYTLIGLEPVAANSLPISTQTTVVPVGLELAANGDYTFAMPDGTSGVSVTLIDNVANTRTNLGLTDYTVNLTAGTIDGRFLLEISPVQQTPTGIEEVTGYGLPVTGARKVMIDGIMYIVKDGKVFDATGQRVK